MSVSRVVFLVQIKHGLKPNDALAGGFCLVIQCNTFNNETGRTK